MQPSGGHGHRQADHATAVRCRSRGTGRRGRDAASPRTRRSPGHADVLAGAALHARRRVRVIRPRTASSSGRASRRIPSHGGGMSDRNGRSELGSRARREHAAGRPAAASSYARPKLAHSVHVDVEGLEPGREYFYRFVAGPQESPVGRTRTAPSKSASERAALCVRLVPGLAERLLHGLPATWLKRTSIWSSTSATTSTSTDRRPRRGRGRHRARARRAGGVLLESYRNRHALYKTDAALQAAHAAAPWMRHLGRPRDREQLRRRHPGGGELAAGDFARAARERRPAPTTSTSRCGSRSLPGREGAAALPERSTGAVWRSSTCSTRGSSAPTSRAATG